MNIIRKEDKQDEEHCTNIIGTVDVENSDPSVWNDLDNIIREDWN